MHPKIKILYVFHTSIIGGGSFCLLNIVKSLDKDLYTPIVLLRNDGPLVSELKKNGAEVFFEKSIATVPYNKSLFSILSIIQWLGVMCSMPKILRFLKKSNIHIIHLNTMMMYPYLFLSAYLKIKSVIHIRENWPKSEHIFQLNLARKVIQSKADKIVAINQTSAGVIDFSKKTTVVYDTIDFANREDKFEFSEVFGDDYLKLKIFVFFGGFNPQKGTLQVVETFRSAINGDDLRLLIVGAELADFSKLSIKNVLKRVFSFFNHYTYSDKVMRSIACDSRIKVIPSSYHILSIIKQSYGVLSFFTIPHANLLLAESICLEKPVIAAATSEAYEYSNGGEAALLYDMLDTKDFERKINYLLNNYDQNLVNKIKTGANVLVKQFDRRRNANLLHQVYTNLLEI